MSRTSRGPTLAICLQASSCVSSTRPSLLIRRVGSGFGINFLTCFVICFESGGSTTSTLGSLSRDHYRSPVHHGVSECGGGLSESPGSGDRVRVDPSPGGSRRVGEKVDCDGRFVCHFPQLPSSGILLSPQRPDGRSDGCISSVLRWASGVCLSTVHAHTQRPQQTAVVQGDI